MAIKAGNKENVELRKIVLCISSARFSIFDFHEKICNEPKDFNEPKNFEPKTFQRTKTFSKKHQDPQIVQNF